MSDYIVISEGNMGVQGIQGIQGEQAYGDFTATPKTADFITKGPRCDIRAFGGLDDYGVAATPTNCQNAFDQIQAAYPDGCTIKLPRTISGAYYIAGNNYTHMDKKYLLDPDVGVSIQFDGTSFILDTDTTRPIKCRHITTQSDFRIVPLADIKDKAVFMSRGDAETAVVPIAINPIADCNHHAITWDTFTVVPFTPSNVTSDTVVYNSFPANCFAISTINVTPGNEQHACFAQYSYAGLLCVAVITDKGFSFIQQDSVGGNFGVSTKSGTDALVTTGKVNAFNNRYNYYMASAMVGIRINSYKSYSLLLNGLEVVRVDDAGGTILEAGWGGGFERSTSGLSIAQPTLIKGKKSRGIKPLKVVICGDSITYAGWPNYFRQYIAGLSGVQITDMLNLSYPGQTSVGQNSLLNATDISGYDYCLIQVGANDIQTGSPVGQLPQYVGYMIDKCEANNVIPIVGIPTMWYEQADAIPYGNTGGASAHSNDGSAYRLALMRMLATRGARVNMLTLEDWGAVVPSLLANGNADPIVADNLHPSVMGSRLLGYGWAKILAGEINLQTKSSNEPSAILDSWLGSGFSVYNGTYSIKNSILSLNNILSYSGGTIADGTVLLTLPKNLRPTVQKTITMIVASASGAPSGICFATIFTTGVIGLYGVPVSTGYFYVSNVSYPLGD